MKMQIRFIAAWFVLVASLSTSVFGEVRVNIPGNKFTVVAGTATGEDTADGRKFRLDQHQIVTIKGYTSIPVFKNAAQQYKMTRLAVHFHTFFGGPSLNSIQLCNGSKCYNPFNCSLSGNYSTKEVVHGKNSPYANVWLFTPPIMVNTTFSVVLKVGSPTLYDEGSLSERSKEFTLVSVDADFPDAVRARMGSPKHGPAALQKKITTGVDTADPVRQQHSYSCGQGGDSREVGIYMGWLAGDSTKVLIDRLTFFYQTRNGEAVVFEKGADGQIHLIKCYATGAFTPGWTHIVSTPNGVLFYNSANGAGVVGRFDESGTFTNLNSYSFSSGWTTVRYFDDDIEFRNDKTGAMAVGEIGTDGAFITK